MPVPSHRKSRSAVRRRRSHDRLTPAQTGLCESCHAPVLTHHACPACGNYNGRKALDTSRNTARAMRRKTQGRSEPASPKASKT